MLEPKWDGFRAVLQVTPEGRVTYWSRKGTNLSTAFPDLVEAARDQVPAGVVLDGELVVWVEGRLSFDHLQHRMASRPSAVGPAGAAAPSVLRRVRHPRRRRHRRAWAAVAGPSTALGCAGDRLRAADSGVAVHRGPGHRTGVVHRARAELEWKAWSPRAPAPATGRGSGARG